MAIEVWKKLRFVIADIVFFLAGCLAGILITKTRLSDLFSIYFLIQLLLWLGVSALFMKYSGSPHSGITRMTGILLLCNSIIFLLGTFGINLLIPSQHIAKRFFFVTVLISSILEFIFFSFFLSYLAARKKSLWEAEEIAYSDAGDAAGNQEQVTMTRQAEEEKTNGIGSISEEIRNLIAAEIGTDGYNKLQFYFTAHVSPMLLVSTNTRFNVLSQPLDEYGTIVNLKQINDIRYINKFFEAVNKKLKFRGIFIGRAEVYSTRKKRILSYYFPGINYLVYTFDFIINRLFPKLPFTKQVYFFFTKGHERLVSRTEILGRLYSCGFEVVEELEADNLLYFIGRKIREPYFDNNPTYGALIRLNRVGKDGRIIGVYKVRTMHPYSEYLQPYIYEKNKLREGGKIRDDFRVTTIGAFARKFWIDELPMLINLIKGEVKLVGVRPLSKHFFDLYSPELKEKRIKYKPGLIPPYYADMPKTLEEVMASEMKYLESYERNPLKTDIVYLKKALYHIFIKKARSG